MKKINFIMTSVIVLSLASCSVTQPAATVDASQLKTAKDSLSYVLGVSMAENLQKQGVGELNNQVTNSAFNAILAGNEPIIDLDTRDAILKDYFNQQKEVKEKEAKAEEIAFLALNKKKAGVNELPSGLQYKVLTKGTGTETPTRASKVTVHYTGKLTNGKVFDSSVQRGEPATFGVTQVIKGWTEALQLMHVGDKFELYIPSSLAYGARGAGNDIKPFSLLIFEVELLAIK